MARDDGGGKFPRQSGAAGRDAYVAGRDLTVNIHSRPDLREEFGGESAPVFAVPRLTGSEVHRPELLEPLVTRLCVRTATQGGRGEQVSLGLGQSAVETVGIAGLEGAGGFGKTTLATIACHDGRVRERFPDGIVWVTVGQNVRGPALANRINEVAELLSGRRPTFTDAEAAGQHLGMLFGTGHSLLVIDDVWHRDQLAPFLLGGQGCVRLVTTRSRNILPQVGAAVMVDAMPADQAMQLLTEGLGPDTDRVNLSGLVQLTGGWPVLIALVNRALKRRLRYGGALATAVEALIREITSDGPTILDITSSSRRQDAVAATVHASESLLAEANAAWVDRYHELAVFPDDTDIPLTTAAALWSATGNATVAEAEQLVLELADLCMIQLQLADSRPSFRIHDVVHAYLRHEAGDRLARYHLDLVRAHRGQLATEHGRTSWWLMPATEPYLWDHLALHLAEGGASGELTDLIHDLRWPAARIHVSGAANVEADLTFLPADRQAQALASLLQQTSHLFHPQDSLPTVRATLAAYGAGVPALVSAAHALARQFAHAYLAPVQYMPDQPHPALFRSISGHEGQVSAMAVTHDAAWLATGDNQGTVRVWDPRGGVPLAVLAGHIDRVTAIALTSRASWLASGARDRTVRLWDLRSGDCLAVLHGHTDQVDALVIAPDASWLASASPDGTVRVWDPGSGRCRFLLRASGLGPSILAVAPDGSWLASASRYRETVRIWDPATGRALAALSGHSGDVSQLAVGPAGLLASAGKDGSVRVWKPPDKQPELVIDAHEAGTTAVLFTADGRSLISAGGDGVIKVWDLPSGRPKAVLPQRVLGVSRLEASPDCSWLASGGSDGTVRVWRLPSGHAQGVYGAHPLGGDHLAIGQEGAWLASGSTADTVVRIWKPTVTAADPITAEAGLAIEAMAVARDRTRFATGDRGGQLRVWNYDTPAPAHVVPAHLSEIQAITFAPGGSWLATADRTGQIRIWDPATGLARAAVTSPHSTDRTANLAGSLLLGSAPDDSWLASGSSDGAVRIWDPVTGTQLDTLTPPAARSRSVRQRADRGVRGLLVAPDGSWLANAIAEGSVLIWDMNLGKLSQVLLHGTRPGPVSGAGSLVGLRQRPMAVAPDGSWLATSGRDGGIRLWEPLSGSLLLELDTADSGASVLATGPFGRWLAAGGRDGSVLIWDTATGERLRQFVVHEGRVQALAISGDGTRLASVGDDGTVHVWDGRQGQSMAMLRTDSRLRFAVWGVDDKELIIAGNRGLCQIRLTELEGGEP
jgi:WD40 repeat protein